MIIAFHNPNFMAPYFSMLNQPGTTPTIDFKKLTQVAVVNTDNLSEAFQMVQHHEQPWYNNPDIQVIQEARNTSVGDVLQTKDGEYWLIGLEDFLSLGKLQKNKISSPV